MPKVPELTSSTLPKPPIPKVANIDRSLKNSLENSFVWLWTPTGGLGANLRLQKIITIIIKQGFVGTEYLLRCTDSSKG